MSKPGIQTFLLLFGSLWLGIGLGCLNDEENEDCWINLCNRTKPSIGSLRIMLSPGASEVVIYAGENVETGRAVFIQDHPPSEIALDLSLGSYAGMATYRSGEKTLLAIDGDDLVASESEECGETCYGDAKGKIDLRIPLITGF